MHLIKKLNGGFLFASIIGCGFDTIKTHISVVNPLEAPFLFACHLMTVNVADQCKQII